MSEIDCLTSLGAERDWGADGVAAAGAGVEGAAVAALSPDAGFLVEVLLEVESSTS
jgi:hypothetical protein